MTYTVIPSVTGIVTFVNCLAVFFTEIELIEMFFIII